jgi:hypothetical protein
VNLNLTDKLLNLERAFSILMSVIIKMLHNYVIYC